MIDPHDLAKLMQLFQVLTGECMEPGCPNDAVVACRLMPVNEAPAIAVAHFCADHAEQGLTEVVHNILAMMGIVEPEGEAEELAARYWQQRRQALNADNN